MTIQQHAEQIANMPEFESLSFSSRRKLTNFIRQAMNAAVNAAVEEEREACAKIAEEEYHYRYADDGARLGLERVRDKIRARCNKSDGGTK